MRHGMNQLQASKHFQDSYLFHTVSSCKSLLLTIILKSSPSRTSSCLINITLSGTIRPNLRWHSTSNTSPFVTIIASRSSYLRYSWDPNDQMEPRIQQTLSRSTRDPNASNAPTNASLLDATQHRLQDERRLWAAGVRGVLQNSPFC